MFDIITCVNDVDKHSLLHGDMILKRNGYELNFIPIFDAQSMAEGYNRGFHQAKYDIQIYVHQDVRVLNNNFLSDILKVFAHDEKIGAVGFVGTKKLPPSCVFWDDLQQCVGEVIEWRGSGVHSIFNRFQESFVEVEMVDGFCIVSKVKIAWNEKIPSWHFYDVAYCQDVRKSGHKVVVPNQNENPWLYHVNKGNDKFDANEYMRVCNIFKREYKI